MPILHSRGRFLSEYEGYQGGEARQGAAAFIQLECFKQKLFIPGVIQT